MRSTLKEGFMATGLVLLAVMLLVVALCGSTLAVAPLDVKKSSGSQADRVDEFNVMPRFERLDRQMTSKDVIDERRVSSQSRVPLGAASASPGIGVGYACDAVFEDVQGRYGTHMGSRIEPSVDGAGDMYVHFTYNDQSDTVTVPTKSPQCGYNVYDPQVSAAFQWPHGQFAGGDFQSSSVDTAAGYVPNIAVNPNSGYVVGACYDWGKYGANEDFGNRIYWQTSPTSADFTPDSIPFALYNPNNWLPDGDGDLMQNPTVAIQEIGGTRYTHVVGGSQGWYSWHGTSYGSRPVSHYYTTSEDGSGGWIDGGIADTSHHWNYCMAVQPNGSKIGVAVIHYSPSGIANDNERDNDVYFNEKDMAVDPGPTGWMTTSVNLTSWDRMGGTSYTPFVTIDAVYDHLGYFHVVFDAMFVPQDPDGIGRFDWGRFTSGIIHATNHPSSVWHAVVGDGNYGPAANTIICGFGLMVNSYVAQANISECQDPGGDYHLYVTWNQIHPDIPNQETDPDIIYAASRDCSDEDSPDAREHKANYEMFLSVSTSEVGDLWDAPLNLSDTQTPGCDGDPSGELCGNEWFPNMSEHGFDEAGLADLDYNAAVTHPNARFAGYSGTRYLFVSYL
ncbi:MAG: hypothetical protein DRP45_06670, partial [Candidatus Zixiibacteriota bacterium]